jgi:hypothetical protein
MNIRQALEKEHSKPLTTAIVNYIGNDKARFKELMDVFMKGEYRLTQRAAWPLSYVCIAEPGLVKPYFGQLIKKLKEPGHHPAISRNILRMFQEIDIPEKYQSDLIDECLRIIQNPSLPVAIVAFAITTAAKLCRPFPELRNELLLVLNQLNSYPQTAAIKVRVKKAIKDLN